MLDASAFLGTWAFRSSAARTTGELVEQLQENGIVGAAVSPAEAILHPEPMAANRRFLKQVTADESDFRLIAVPVVDPSLPNWRAQVEECISVGGKAVRGVKVLPNYQDYDLSLPALGELAQMLGEKGLSLSIQVRMEDERSRHPRMQVSGVPAPDVAGFASEHPKLQILVCGGYMAELRHLSSANNVSVEMSFVESGNALTDALAQLGQERLLVGTHAPLYDPTVGVSKAFGDDVDEEVRANITSGNFSRIFG